MRTPSPAHAGQKPSAVVYHDYFAIRGGGEKLVLTLAKALAADLTFGYRTEDTYEATKFPPDAKNLDLSSAFRRSGVRPLALAATFSKERQSAARHHLRLFSGVAAPFAAPENVGGRNVFYCHTPPRFLFDQRAHFVGQLSLPARMAAQVLLPAFERGYRRAIERMDLIVTNSQTTRERIQHYLGRDAEIVYPPCDTNRYRWQGQDDYYLSSARLTSLKRVDQIVDAFLKMPDKKLVVASGGEDLEGLKARARGANNIRFTGWVDDETLETLTTNAIASIYLARDEDFGMTPVEAMSAGKPVIGVAEGGLRETIVDGETGVLLPSGFSTEDLISAVNEMTPEFALSMRVACEARAEMFDTRHFVARMREVLGLPDDAG